MNITELLDFLNKNAIALALFSGISSFVTAIAALFTAIATFFTIRQISMQREASYRPEVVISSEYFKGKKSAENKGIPSLWISKSSESKPLSEQNVFKLSLFNLGLGAAKNIHIRWSFSFDTVMTHIEAITTGTEYESSFSFKNGVLSCASESIGKWVSMWRNQNVDGIDFILPASEIKEGCQLKLPDAYVKIISILVFLYSKLSLFEVSTSNMPEINLVISYHWCPVNEKIKTCKIL